MSSTAVPAGLPPGSATVFPWAIGPHPVPSTIVQEPTQAQQPGENIAAKPCLTCRRRHVRCDKHIPKCHRCIRFGRLCPGYASSSRGKAGHKAAVSKAQDAGSSPPVPAYLTVPENLSGNGFGVVGQEMATETRQEGNVWVYSDALARGEIPRDGFNGGLMANGTCGLETPADEEDMFDFNNEEDQESNGWLSTLQSDESNPCRQFLSMVPFSPLIRNLAMLLASHQAGTTSQAEIANNVELLRWKSEALEGFIRGIEDGDTSDVTVATTVFLVWIGLYDHELGVFFGSHLAAMRELLRARGLPNGSMGHAALPLKQRPLSLFQEQFEEVYLILSTIGTAFMRDKEDPSVLFPLPAIAAVSSRAERRGWIDCPGELLQSIATINKLAAMSPSPSIEFAPALPGPGPPTPPATPSAPPELIAAVFDHLDRFSPREWSIGMNIPSPLGAVEPASMTHLEDRYHIASVYKAAVCIYATHALGVWNTKDSRAVVDEGIHHLNQISTESPHFMGTRWPCVVLGFEAQSAPSRAVVRNVLARHTGTGRRSSSQLSRAQALMEKIWSRNEFLAGSRSWLDKVYENEVKLMLV